MNLADKIRNSIHVVSPKDNGLYIDDIHQGIINISNDATTELGFYFSNNFNSKFHLHVDGELIQCASVSSFMAWLHWGDFIPELASHKLRRRDFITLRNEYGKGRLFDLMKAMEILTYANRIKIRKAKIERLRDLSQVKALDYYHRSKEGLCKRPSYGFMYTVALKNAILAHRHGETYTTQLKPLHITGLFKEEETCI